VTVTPEGDGFLVTPSGVFLGTLGPDGSSIVTFNVTPLRQTFIRFRANFKNGINPHTSTLTLPLSTVENRLAADPVLTNIHVTTELGAIHVSGDVTNVGLETARSVTVTTQGGVTPVDPYKVYVVGSLEPDDIASFEVTFRSKTTVGEVPLLVTYKDRAGNIITSTSNVEISSQALSDQATEPSRFTNLLVWMFVILIAAVFIYFWRRG
jgi:PKD repeat protein